jgi:hypothetical protein
LINNHEQKNLNLTIADEKIGFNMFGKKKQLKKLTLVAIKFCALITGRTD